MSYNFYNLDGIITQLKKDRDIAIAKLQAWSEVTFPTKKDGTPFKIMSKNISGATYFQEEYALQPGQYKIRVGGWSDSGGYFTDEIYAHSLVKYTTDETMLAKIQNYQPKQSYLEQVYMFDLDDIKKAIAHHVAMLKKQIASYNTQIDTAQAAFIGFSRAYKTAVEQLEAAAGERSDLYYYIKDTVQARYPYI